MQENKHLIWLTVNRSWSHSSLALSLLHRAARNISDWEWERLEITTEEDTAAAAAGISLKKCDLLCATLYLFNRMKVLDILKRVHVLAPTIHIAVGGPECPGSDAQKILNAYPFISSVFSGEGEQYFPDFLQNFEFRKNTRNIIPENRSAIYEKWTDSDFPVHDEFFRTDKPFIQIETSRGCPMSCAYCTSSGVKVRYRELPDVERELNLLEEKGVREIRVLDRTFNLPQTRGAALLRMFRMFPKIHFHLEIHPQFLGTELQECFRDALPGQLHVEAGIQSLDPAVQQAIGRRSEIEAALQGLHFLTHCTGFQTHTDLLAGLPAQTLKSLQNDIVKLMQVRPAEIQLETLKMLPGTPILDHAEQYGMVWSPDPPYDVMRTDTMTAEDILYAKRLSRLLDLFYNHEFTHPVILKAAQENSTVFLHIADHLQNRDLNTLMDLKKRMLYLAEFFGNAYNAAREELTFQWLMSGYPAGEGPAKDAVPVRSVPAEAHCISGPSECLTHRDSRFLQIHFEGKLRYLVNNRSFRCNKPCGIWETPC